MPLNSSYGYSQPKTAQAKVATMTITDANQINQQELNKAFDDIAVYLTDGYFWHKRSANCSRKNAIRGLGRWHDCEAKQDAKIALKLEKCLIDRFNYEPNINVEYFDKSVKYNFIDLKQHLEFWIEREKPLINSLNYVIGEMRMIDIAFYEELCCIQKEVQDEILRVKLLLNRLSFGEFGKHDVAICSMIIHKYFEEEHKDGEIINFNLG